jgi:SAM-dependent methyltransferase
MNNKNYDIVATKFDELRNKIIGVMEILEITQKNFPKPRVLDLGCGTGLPIGSQVCKIAFKYIGVDNSREMINIFKRNIPDAESYLLDITEIDLIDGQFDLIFGWGSVCHLNIADQKILFQKIYSKLKNGGIFAFTGGEHEETCSGSVGELSIIHSSMGKSKYIQLGIYYKLDFLSANYCSGNNYLYQFRKTAQQVDEP